MRSRSLTGVLHLPRSFNTYCQTPYKQIVRFEELVITALAWQDVLYGDLIYRFLPTNAPPLSDHYLAGNNRILEGLIKKFRKRYGLISAEFIGGRYGALSSASR